MITNPNIVNNTTNNNTTKLDSYAVAYHNAVQSIADSTLTAMAMNSEDFDTNTYHSTVTNNSRMTVPTTGTYLIIVNANFAANATGNRQIVLYKNGTQVQFNVVPVSSAGVATIAQATFFASATAGDYFEAFIFQNSGGALNTGSATRTAANSVTVIRLT